MVHKLLETVDLASAKVDSEAGIVRGVKILGIDSRNRRRYSDKARESAAKFYEGIQVNINHPDRANPGAERSFYDRFGELRGVTNTKDGVFGDLHYLKSHPAATQFVEAATRMPSKVGLSHNAEGRLKRDGDKWIVEDVESVRSVDVVSDPATNRGLFESANEYKTVLEIFQEQGNKRAVSLIEELPAISAMPADSSGGDQDQMKSAFMAALGALLDMPKDEAKAKAKKLLDAYFSVQDDDEQGGEPMAESVNAKPDPTLVQLQEQVATLTQERNQLAVEREFQAATVEPSAVLVEAALALGTPEKRKEFIESLPKKQAAVQPPLFSRPLYESSGAAVTVPAKKDFASAIR